MACRGCDSNGCSWNIIMPCGVCTLNNNDASPKRVCWCAVCWAYICKEHWDSPVARTVAAVKNVVINVIEELKTVLKKKRTRINKDNDTPATPA